MDNKTHMKSIILSFSLSKNLKKSPNWMSQDVHVSTYVVILSGSRFLKNAYAYKLGQWQKVTQVKFTRRYEKCCVKL